jgi:hypothetical protein
MHVLIPFAAALSDAAAQVLRDQDLPHLARLLGRLAPTRPLGSDEYSPSPPHEAALAAAWGWSGGDGTWPFAALAAREDGVDAPDRPVGLLTPVHWQVGHDHVTLADPNALALDAEESRALFDAVRVLFETEGLTLAWGAPQRWYALGDRLDGLACASLDRVIGRNVDRWLPGGDLARPLRRLQSEAQMLLYTHPVNEAREKRGVWPVNSFWLSGCGRPQPRTGAPVQVNATLRQPLLSEDWPAWAAAWRALDAGALAMLWQRCERGEPVMLTLCGERHAQRFESAPRSVWQRLAERWQAIAPYTVLETL